MPVHWYNPDILLDSQSELTSLELSTKKTSRKKPATAMQNFWLFPNLLASIGSSVGGVIAFVNPSALSGSSQVNAGELYYQRMYTARALPLGILSGVLPFYHEGPVVASIILAAATVQAVDVAIGYSKGDLGMMVGASVATAIHTLFFFSLY